MYGDVKVISTRNYRAGYIVRKEERQLPGEKGSFVMSSAYNLNDEYIGSSKTAYRLCKKRGIKPEKADPNDCVCSIGYCSAEEKWAGWSHRCLCFFGIDDRLFEEDYGDEDTLYTQHGEVIIENLEQAKQAAIRFADYVG